MKSSIQQIHLEQCSSTQSELQSHLDRSLYDSKKTISPRVLISTSTQNKGIGRHNNIWDHYEGAIACSFTVPANQTLTLTPLEMGVLVIQFFSNLFSIKLLLKWPNDILTEEGNKCGGIICKSHHEIVLIGIGLNIHKNISPINHQHYKIPFGTILKEKSTGSDFQQSIPLNLYEYILQSRLNADSVRKFWNKGCAHINSPVRIETGSTTFEGIFQGIDLNGLAILQDHNNVKHLIPSGSLYINPE